jgi:hypothetical protein
MIGASQRDLETAMLQKPSSEILSAIPEVAERNVAQSLAAYVRTLTMGLQAQQMMAQSQGDAVKNAMDAQNQALRVALQKEYACFRLAPDLARSRSIGVCGNSDALREDASADVHVAGPGSGTLGG